MNVTEPVQEDTVAPVNAERPPADVDFDNLHNNSHGPEHDDDVPQTHQQDEVDDSNSPKTGC